MTDTTFDEFLDKVRQLSITGTDRKEAFFFNGWSQLFAMKMLLPQYADEISEEQVALVKKALGELEEIDLTRNVRGEVKEVLRYPFWPGYPLWEDHSNEELEEACLELSNQPHRFNVVDGKLYLMLPPFSERLKGFVDNDEDPHLTIVNSDKFDPKKHSKFEGVIIQDVVYKGLSATPAMDYPPFVNVIVVKCSSETISDEFGKDELHYTIKRVLREPYHFG